jgi:hypothetical protein
MSFDITQRLDTIDTVQYNYYPTNFYKGQYQDTFKNSGYIKIPYTSKQNEPNIAVFGSGYVTSALYIVEPTHLIKNVKYDAELIIEHRSLTNYNDPLYTCFLLKTSQSSVYTDIDKLIEGLNDTSLDLNILIQPQKTIVFKNNLLKSALVIIFTNPIMVNTNFEGLKQGISFLAPYVNNYSILNAEPILGSKSKTVIEGLANPTEPTLPAVPTLPSLSDLFNTSDDTPVESTPPAIPTGTPPAGFYAGSPVTVAGYCQPIDETDPSIEQTANVVIPIDSQLSKNTAEDSTIRLMLNFFGFFVLVVAAIFITPIAHRVMIVELILDNDTFSAQRKLNRSNAADVYTGFVLFGFAIAFMNYGIINNKTLATILGFYVFIFLMASILVLQYQRIFNPTSYLSQFKTKGVLPSFEDMEMDWGFFTDNISSLFFEKKMIPNEDPNTNKAQPMKSSYSFSFTFLILGGIIAGIYYVLKKLKVSVKGGKFFLTSIYFYILLFSMYLIALINHYRYINKKLYPTT